MPVRSADRAVAGPAPLREPRGVVWPRSRCYGPPSTGADGRRRHRKTSRPVRRRRAR